MAARFRNPREWERWLPWAAVLFGLATRVFLLARFDGRWLDSDTARLTPIIHGVWTERTLNPAATGGYSNGFAYPVLAGFHARAMGMDVAAYQSIVQPLLGVLFLLAVLFLARRLTTDPIRQSWAVFLAALSPEILFETFRGSHGAYSLSAFVLGLACFLALLQPQARFRAAWSLLATLFLSAAVVLNIYFGVVAVTTTAFVLLVWKMLAWRRRLRPAHVWQGSAWALLLVPAILVVTMGSWYAPATMFESTARDLAQNVANLAPVDVQPADAGPGGNGDDVGSVGNTDVYRQRRVLDAYTYVPVAWDSFATYIAFTLWNPVFVTIALVAWVYQIPRIWSSRPPVDPRRFVLWGVHAALGLWMGFSLVQSVFSNLVGTNLQYRVFGVYAIGAALLAGDVLAGADARVRGRPRGWPRAGVVAVTALLAWLAIAGPVKVANEPLVNRHWLYVEPGEATFLVWMGSHVSRPLLWGGPDDPGWDNRLENAHAHLAPEAPRISIDWSFAPPAFVLSRTVVAHAAVMNVSLPSVADYDRIYDNGAAQYYMKPGL